MTACKSCSTRIQVGYGLNCRSRQAYDADASNEDDAPVGPPSTAE